MAGPVLTPAEIEQLEKEKAIAENTVAAYTQQAANLQVRIDELTVTDGSFKKFFDYYNDDIIKPYDDERKALDGVFIAGPIVENDIIQAAAGVAHRTTPTPPATDLVRIPEFDGGNTTTTDINETKHIADQADIEDLLVNGQSGTAATVTMTTLTASTLDSSSTTLNLTDSSGSPSFSVGDEFVVYDASNAALVRVLSIGTVVTGPPYTVTLDIEFVVEPSGSIPAGANLESPFDGFNNTERTNKVSSNPDLQPLMDSLITILETQLNNRIARLDEQIAAIALNQDPDGTAQLTQADADADTSKAFIENYLLTTDISDTGVGSLASERGTRSGEISTRIGQILANYTGQTEDYYERRYSVANDRANTSRGTLRQLTAAQDTQTQAGAYAASAQDSADAFAALIP